ncbi:Membrane associated serine protease, rhomboid family [Clostridium cavendishii DSM 21758]|uniref:Membrane associated serine protease, rhomboid family n=1 Tax=Clostridium cavendishii DSM 21758 TaxID=1121302 RepID=A0A1M6CNL2_9CLOT|nr:rhomboid family intramembrane serine protease [Clostridium cavendishii]SHI62384.1 Membrane associated serine protease, rhomboid family [Clostridium cavendishii DSM 21758]
MLIAINLIVFIISAIKSGSVWNIKKDILVELGAKVNYLINGGEYERLIKSMFLHSGLIHFVFNMYALYSLGNLINQIYGTKKYLIIYFLSGIVASFTSYKLSYGVSVGASGAIFGLLGSCLFFAYKEKQRIGKEFFIDIISVIILNLIIGLSIPNIDNSAHFGGLFAGIIITFFIYNQNKIIKIFKKE